MLGQAGFELYFVLEHLALHQLTLGILIWLRGLKNSKLIITFDPFDVWSADALHMLGGSSQNVCQPSRRIASPGEEDA